MSKTNRAEKVSASTKTDMPDALKVITTIEDKIQKINKPEDAIELTKLLLCTKIDVKSASKGLTPSIGLFSRLLWSEFFCQPK